MIDDLAAVLQKLSAGDHNQNPINTKENFFANPTLSKMTTASDYLTGGQAGRPWRSRKSSSTRCRR